MKGIHGRRAALSVSLIAFLTVFGIFAAACTAEAKTVVYAMDTVSQIRIYRDGKAEAEALAEEAETLLNRYDAVFSAQSGDIAALNGGRLTSLSGEAAETAEKALYIKELSGGAFTPELGALTSLWNVSALVGTVASPPTDEEISAALSKTGSAEVNGGVLTVAGDIELDLGGIAKGAACSYIAEAMKRGGASGGIIDLGGNIGVFGKKPDGSDVYRVAVTCAGEAYAYIGVKDACVSVASSELRWFSDGDGNRYHHILDPDTGYPAESEFYAVAVVCRDGAYADALSTAVFIVGWNAALEMREHCTEDFDIVALTRSGEVKVTENNKVINGAVETAPGK